MNDEDPVLPAELDEKVRVSLLDGLRSKPNSFAVLAYALDGGYRNEKGYLLDGAGPHLILGWYEDHRKLTGGRFYRLDNARVYVDDVTIDRIRGKRLVSGKKTQIIDGSPMSFGYIRIVEQQ